MRTAPAHGLLGRELERQLQGRAADPDGRLAGRVGIIDSKDLAAEPSQPASKCCGS